MNIYTFYRPLKINKPTSIFNVQRISIKLFLCKSVKSKIGKYISNNLFMFKEDLSLSLYVQYMFTKGN